MQKLSLDMILNKNTKEEICKQYSKKLVSNDINDFKIGEPLKIKYLAGSSFTHEDIVDIEEDDYGFWIETTKKLWRFNYGY